jgi:hypothetical protein
LETSLNKPGINKKNVKIPGEGQIGLFCVLYTHKFDHNHVVAIPNRTLTVHCGAQRHIRVGSQLSDMNEPEGLMWFGFITVGYETTHDL